MSGSEIEKIDILLTKFSIFHTIESNLGVRNMVDVLRQGFQAGVGEFNKNNLFAFIRIVR